MFNVDHAMTMHTVHRKRDELKYPDENTQITGMSPSKIPRSESYASEISDVNEEQLLFLLLKVLVPIHILIPPNFFQTYGDFGTRKFSHI